MPASTAIGAATHRGASSATPVANAAAEAEWPDGNACEVGNCQRIRTGGTRSTRGRLRRKACLPNTLTSGLAMHSATEPRSAARRSATRRVAASTAAVPNHRTPLSAALDSLGRTYSSPGR